MEATLASMQSSIQPAHRWAIGAAGNIINLTPGADLVARSPRIDGITVVDGHIYVCVARGREYWAVEAFPA